MTAPIPPHIAQAGHYLPALTFLALMFGGIGMLALVGAIIASLMTLPDGGALLGAVALIGSSLLIPTTGFAAAGLVGTARRQLAGVTSSETKPPKPQEEIFETEFTRYRQNEPVQDSAARDVSSSTVTWMRTLVSVYALLAAGGVIWSWRHSAGVVPDGSIGLILGGVLIVLAFPILLLERTCANIDPNALPEAGQLQWLLRVPLATMLGLGVGFISLGAGFGWPKWIGLLLGILILLISAELILRVAITLFLPVPPLEEVRSVAESVLARILRFALPNVTSVNLAVERQFGVDLSRSWAIGFVARAAAPVGFTLLLLTWGLTGVTALGMDTRAVYERFGAPVRVVGPGLHVGLPWPLGIMRRVEFGVLHATPVAVADASLVTGSDFTPAAASVRLPTAEAMNPTGADRLWDETHPSEASYLVASATDGRQSFQSVDIDIRLVYRVGLSDKAAMAAAYQIENPDQLVRASAGRLLSQYFASHTLLGVLVANRETFAVELRTALQAELDRLNSGQEVLAVVVEEVHPPPGAANAYHKVQAAEIASKVSVATQTGAAARNKQTAQEEAIRIRDQATASSAETLGAAQAEQELFDGDHLAYTLGGKAFLLERWFDRVRTALGRTNLVIVDHRLSGQEAPTIDLRDLAPPATLPLPRSN